MTRRVRAIPAAISVGATAFLLALGACMDRPVGVEEGAKGGLESLRPAQLAVLACPPGTSGANCVSCEVYANDGTCAESSCAQNGGWIGNLDCDPYDCRHGYWWCTYPPESEDPGPSPYVYMTCPASVERGGHVSCELWAELSPSKPVDFTVDGKTKISRDSMVSFSQDYGHFETYTDGVRFTWEGRLAARTEVKIYGTASGRAFSRSAVIAVTPRQWSPWSGQNPDVSYTVRAPMDSVLRINTPAGLWDPYDTEPFLPSNFTVDSIVDDGPNDGISFVGARPSDPGHRINIHPDLLPDGRLSALHNGVQPNCGPGDVVAFRNRVEVHEGVTKHPTLSHWGLHATALTSHQPQRGLEILLRYTGLNAPFAQPLDLRSWEHFEAWTDSVKVSVQDPFDSADYPNVNAHGCVMTFPS